MQDLRFRIRPYMFHLSGTRDVGKDCHETGDCAAIATRTAQ